jgi:hypothetical protein
MRTFTLDWLTLASRLRSAFLLAVLTLAAVLVHGYHPFAEDAEVYLPSVLKLLDPALFPHDQAFALSHARWTLFPYLMAGSIGTTRLPLETALLLWHLITVFALLWACLRLARLCFRDEAARWCGVALVAGLLTIPVAGTALYIMDQYLTSRSLATPAAMVTLACVLEGRRGRAAGWLAFTAAVHPLTGALAASLWLALWLAPRIERRPAHPPAVAAGAAPLAAAYGQVLRGHPYLFLTRWAWYEWLGALAPLAILAGFAYLDRRRRFGPVAGVCRALIGWQTAFVVLGLGVSLPAAAAGWARLQPMRSLHLLYILMFLLTGCLLGQFALRRRWWAWALLFLPLGGGMFAAQRALFPATNHLEWPGRPSANAWVRAFQWIRYNTPTDAYFALDPQHMRQTGEDQHGFRVLARRSRLADAVKDAGPVTLMPDLADRWMAQVDAQKGLNRFRREDFRRLRRKYGVAWAVVEGRRPPPLACPFQVTSVYVCRIG